MTEQTCSVVFVSSTLGGDPLFLCQGDKIYELDVPGCTSMLTKVPLLGRVLLNVTLYGAVSRQFPSRYGTDLAQKIAGPAELFRTRVFRYETTTGDKATGKKLVYGLYSTPAQRQQLRAGENTYAWKKKKKKKSNENPPYLELARAGVSSVGKFSAR